MAFGAACIRRREARGSSACRARLQTLQTAVTTAASQASAFGNNLSIVQNRQTFTNATINTLQTGGQIDADAKCGLAMRRFRLETGGVVVDPRSANAITRENDEA